jgi:geranylgeranyl reductase family protein
MRDRCQLAIIGAGPAGCATAIWARRLGLESILLMDQHRPGWGKPCAGGISPRAANELKRLGLAQMVQKNAYPISNLRLHGAQGKSLLLGGPVSAWVLERRVFDRLMFEEARSQGVAFTQRRVLGVCGRTGDLSLRTDHGEVRAELVVAADGASCRLRQRRPPPPYLFGAVARFRRVPFEAHTVEMFYCRSWAPHYGWVFPEGGDRVNIGLCVEKNRAKKESLHALWKEFAESCLGHRLKGSVQLTPLRASPIAGSIWPDHPAGDGVLLVGEACRLAQPATGEGIGQALLSGRLAAKAALEILSGRRQYRQAVLSYLFQLRLQRLPEVCAGELFLRLAAPRIELISRIFFHPRFFEPINHWLSLLPGAVKYRLEAAGD